MFNRRDLLKYFAAGTVIAPVAGKSPLAILVEPPKVELFKSLPSVVPIDLSELKSFTVSFEMQDGTTRQLRSGVIFEAKGLVKAADLCADLWIGKTDHGSPEHNSNTGFVGAKVSLV